MCSSHQSAFGGSFSPCQLSEMNKRREGLSPTSPTHAAEDGAQGLGRAGRAPCHQAGSPSPAGFILASGVPVHGGLVWLLLSLGQAECHRGRKLLPSWCLGKQRLWKGPSVPGRQVPSGLTSPSQALLLKAVSPPRGTISWGPSPQGTASGEPLRSKP